jgi:hypothetical protein
VLSVMIVTADVAGQFVCHTLRSDHSFLCVCDRVGDHFSHMTVGAA